ncbi:MAG: transcriptional repressor [Sedimentisphaerales bacterium]|nr:transcriptional repressor [Sedimentisphaerales bacterium]
MQNQDKHEHGHESDPMEYFRRQCQKSGLRITPQREAVFCALVDSTDHPTAESVYQQVRSQMPHISFDTVNRTLNTLCEIGAAFVVPGTGNVRHFDGNLSDHQHFRCIKCKRIVDFHHDPFDNVAVPDTLVGRFIVMHKTVCLEGYCDQCSADQIGNVSQ